MKNQKRNNTTVHYEGHTLDLCQSLEEWLEKVGGTDKQYDEVVDLYSEEQSKKPKEQLQDEGRLWFGSHKGLLWSELSDGEVSWLERNMSGFVKDIASSEIQRRRADSQIKIFDTMMMTNISEKQLQKMRKAIYGNNKHNKQTGD